MDGRAVYNFAVRAIHELVEEIERAHSIGPGDLKAIVPHQANARIIAAAARRLGLPAALFYSNMDRVANTSAASIPIALAEMVATGALAHGDLVLTLGFGAGLTWGANLIRW
jgi:3-oxoacyl-[acyl-carrier-protein] synthase-3